MNKPSANEMTPEFLLKDGNSPRWTLHRARVVRDAIASQLSETSDTVSDLVKKLLEHPGTVAIPTFPRYLRGKARFLRELVLFSNALEKKAIST
jgi:hypothetical protein